MTATTNPTAEQIAAHALASNWDRMHTNESLGRQKMLADYVVMSLRAHNLLSGGPPNIDPASVREAIGEVLADMGATIEDVPVASDLHALTEIADAAVTAATSSPSRTAVPYTTVATAAGDHSQKIRARMRSEGAPSEEQIERAARASFEFARENSAIVLDEFVAFDNLTSDTKEYWFSEARAALTAAGVTSNSTPHSVGTSGDASNSSWTEEQVERAARIGFDRMAEACRDDGRWIDAPLSLRDFHMTLTRYHLEAAGIAPQPLDVDEDELVEIIDATERSTNTGSRPHRHRVIAQAFIEYLEGRQ